MPRFKLSVPVTIEWVLEIEADSEEHAIEIWDNPDWTKKAPFAAVDGSVAARVGRLRANGPDAVEWDGEHIEQVRP